jgi:nucleoside phosphorylase
MKAQRRFRAVALTALSVEYNAVRCCLLDIEPRCHLGSQYEVGRVNQAGKDWDVLVAEIGPGNSTAAAEAERAIHYFKPDLALFIGVAGGVKDVALGDVVAADDVYGYHAGKAAKNFMPRPSVGLSSYDAVQAARVVSRSWNQEHRNGRQSSSRIGKIAAGEQVVSSRTSETFKFLRKQYGDAIAVEMEGRGFLAATRMNSSVQSLVIRGISDLINGKAAADKGGSQERAAQNAADFAMRVLGVLSPPKPRDPRGPKIHRTTTRPGTVTAPSLMCDAAPLQLFVSSRMTPALTRERTIVAKTIESFGEGLVRAWLWEKNGFAGPSERNTCVEAARVSDLLVLLIADDISPVVKAEVRSAVDAGATCFVFAKRIATVSSGCRAFISTLAKRSVPTLQFQNASELRTHLVQRFQRYLLHAARRRRGNS